MADLARSVRALTETFAAPVEIEAEAVKMKLVEGNQAEAEALADDAVATIMGSDGATEDAKAALAQSRAAIKNTRNLARRREQIAYQSLDLANVARAGLSFVRETGAAMTKPLAPAMRGVGRGAAEIGQEAFKGFKRGVGRGSEKLGQAAVIGGAAALTHALGADVMALGMILPPFAPLGQAVEEMTKTKPPELGSTGTASDVAPKAAPSPRGRTKKPSPNKS